VTTSSGIVAFFIPALLTLIVFVFMRAGLDAAIYIAQSLWSLLGLFGR
jgi:hypothetical protein